MAKASQIFAEDDAPVLRFEDAEGDVRGRLVGGGHRDVDDGGGFEDDPFSELKQKQESLLRIRQELERTQRETEELELRKGKEERFSLGRRDICERMSRSLAKLERELYHSQKAIEEISVTREAFQRHLDELREIHPEMWSRAALEDELDRAIGAVEDAEDEYAKSLRRLSAVMPMREEGGVFGGGGLPSDFKGWMLLGLAFSLPMMVTGVLVAVLVLKLGA